MKTKTATPKGSSRKRDAIHDTSLQAQRDRLLIRLQQGPADTLLLRRDLNILAPAARVKELRDQGHEISTRRVSLIDEYGRSHFGIAVYSLIALAPAARAAS
jgi:hypothetical protein